MHRDLILNPKMTRYENHDVYFLEICKGQIEKKLNWSPSETWKQRDYLDLINLIEKETGIILSLSTIKRIWNKDHQATPQKSTLDALASFLGFGDWLEFKSNCGRPTEGEIKISKSKTSKKTIIVAVSAVVLAAILAFVTFNMDNTTKESDTEASISSRNTVPSNVPNTVVFNFDLGGVEADSLFVQQSWNDREKVKIDPNDSVLTTTYYYPGPHVAKLLANDKIIAKTYLNIPTDDWIAISKKDNQDVMPVYVDIDKSNDNGWMTVDKKEFSKHQIPLNPERILSYYYVKDFQDLDPNSFRIRLRIKNERLLDTNCPKVYLGILGSTNPAFIPLTPPGCVGEIDLRIGDTLFKGQNTDLSAFGTNIFEWQDLEFIKTNDEFTILLNETQIFSATVENAIGQLAGLMINFSGIGSVDLVKIDNPKTLVASYAEEF